MSNKVNRAEKRLAAGNFTLPSPDEVSALRSPRGAWTALQLAEWGVPWPPPGGWRTRLRERWEHENPVKIVARREPAAIDVEPVAAPPPAAAAPAIRDDMPEWSRMLCSLDQFDAAMLLNEMQRYGWDAAIQLLYRLAAAPEPFVPEPSRLLL